MKALQIAAQQGQTIYTVTKANYAEILPKLNHSTDVMTDVRNAINAGKEVTISQTQVHAFGWSGTGYIVLDPESGVGAYLIGGGADGGWTNIEIPELPESLGIWALFAEEFGKGVAVGAGKFISKLSDFLDYSKIIKECGLTFALARLAGILAFTAGITGLLLPYLTLVGLVAATALVTVIRLIIIETILIGMYSDAFTCIKEDE